MADFSGGAGKDTYTGTADGDLISGGGGADTLDGGAGDDAIASADRAPGFGAYFSNAISLDLQLLLLDLRIGCVFLSLALLLGLFDGQLLLL